ncbi:MAG: ABC transporter substrate-binding protein, partial [Oscillospiraceae bacterium]|nr:ABC transporter substrate-binding protein [Oscillospiraceae bacterium]
MKSFIKTISIVMALCLMLSACGGSAPAASSQESVSSSAPAPTPSSEASVSSDAPAAEPVTVRLAGMKGPTTMGMVKLLSDSEAGNTKNNYDFFLAGSADEIIPKLIQGKLDLAAVPVNLASVLYNTTQGEIKLLAVNTLGVLYLADTTGEISSIADLKGKTIYATGKGSTPEYTLRYLLKENGLDPDNDVTIEFKSEPTEVVALLKQGGGAAMLPQPFATVAKTQVEGLEIVLDLTREW